MQQPLKNQLIHVSYPSPKASVKNPCYPAQSQRIRRAQLAAAATRMKTTLDHAPTFHLPIGLIFKNARKANIGQLQTEDKTPMPSQEILLTRDLYSCLYFVLHCIDQAPLLTSNLYPSMVNKIPLLPSAVVTEPLDA
jgi:hypothetical protein